MEGAPPAAAKQFISTILAYNHLRDWDWPVARPPIRLGTAEGDRHG